MLFFKNMLDEGFWPRAFPGAVFVVGDNNGMGPLFLEKSSKELAVRRLVWSRGNGFSNPRVMRHTCFNPSPARLDRIGPTGTTNCGRVHDRIAAAIDGIARHLGLSSTVQIREIRPKVHEAVMPTFIEAASGKAKQ